MDDCVSDDSEPREDLRADSDAEKENDDAPVVVLKPEPLRSLPKLTMAEQLFLRFGPPLETVCFPMTQTGACFVFSLDLFSEKRCR